jgi:hypothetical protein
MREIFRYTLLADGSSDKVLIPIIDWVIGQHLPGVRSVSAFARDFGRVGSVLEDRVQAALDYFPCDLLIVHRDAEGMSCEDRVAEVAAALVKCHVPYVALVPVKMSEAWLLSDEAAIRFAAGNASGNKALELPKRQRWETIADPKFVLLQALRIASGKAGRALDKFNPEKARHLITPRTESFERLRGLPAFDAFEADLSNQLEKIRNALD